MALQKARALYDYKSAEPLDLNFAKGDIIEVLGTDPSGWWTGMLNGSKGQFPGEYVEMIQDEEPARKRKPPPPPNARRSDRLVVKVLWDYDAQASDELSVKADDILEVTNSADPDWWLSTKNGKTGILPKNYTEFVGGSAPQSDSLAIQTLSQAAPVPETSMMMTPRPPTMISSGGAYSLGGDVPIWYHPSFVGFVADRHRPSNLDRTLAKDEFDAFAQSFHFLSVIIERVSARLQDQFGSRALMRALVHGAWVASNLPIQGLFRQTVRSEGAPEEEQVEEIDFDKPPTSPLDPSERFHLFLHTLVGRIKEMRSGDAMIIPCGWTADPRSRKATTPDGLPAPPPLRGRYVCVLSSKGETFDFSILQDGESNDGSEYHAATFDSATGKLKRASMHFENIPRFRLSDSSFWFMLFRLVIFPHTSNNIDHVYQILLPYLNQVPLRTASTSRPKFFYSVRSRPGDDLPRVHMVKKALRCALIQHFGVSPRDAKRFLLEVKRELAAMTITDVNTVPSINTEEAFLARLALNQPANSAAKLGDDDSPDMQRSLNEVIENVRAGQELIAKKTVQGTSRFPPKINSVTTASKAAWGAAFPLFGRFRRDTSVEQFAGTRTLPSILRPVQITLVPDSVSSFHDVAVALRHCAHVCTLLDNQKESIKNTYCLRVALIMHLFTHVIPLPSPPTSKSVCFWAAPSREMRYETQADLLRMLELVGRHFTSAALSLHVTRTFDAARVVTMACIATVADAVARKIACDVPSQFSLHLSGQAEGPVYEFGFEMGYFLEESGFLEFTDPYMCAARTQILDYFHAQRQNVDEAHTIFRFEQSMEFSRGDARLVDQLCIQMGFPRDGSRPKTKATATKNPLAGAAEYLTGEDPLLVDNYPELALYRDIVFLFKSLLAPTSSALPPVKAWIATDARLYWKVAKKAAALSKETKKKRKQKEAEAQAEEEEEEDEEDEEIDDEKPDDEVPDGPPIDRDLLPRPILEVSGFGQKQLKCAAFARTYVSKELAENRSAVKSFLGFFGLGGDDRPRAPPSGANPSNLVNETIVTEDDVLHIRNLPDFQGRMGARDCELLLSYLTAPYIRIPLVLQFFAEQTRINCLANSELQNVLDACLFEPSLFMNDTEYQKGPPDTIPVLKRESLGTPVGLLFNELQRSPHVTLRALEDMLFYALELDVGKYSPSSSGVLLYVSRLMVRVTNYLDFICHNAAFLTEGKPSEGGARQRVRGVGGPDELPKPVWNVLEKARIRLRHKLETLVYETLENWCEGAFKSRDLQLACVLHAHMAYLFRGKDRLEFNSACSTLAAFVFVTSNFRFTVEATAGEKKQDRSRGGVSEEVLKRLGINQVELFQFFQEQRPKLMKFFNENPADCNEVMEAVVRVVTLTGTHKRRAEQADPSKLPPNRNWLSLDRPMCEGRFVPDTEMLAYRAALMKIDSVTDFEEWLRQVTTLAVDTEINVQLGEFTLKKNPMQLLPDEFFALEDFKHIIGVYDPTKGDAIQCAEVSNTTNRQWWRLVGRRHDVQLWKPDWRTSIGRASPFKRAYPGGLTAGEQWIKEVLEPYRVSMFPDVDLFLPSGATFDNQHFARLTGLLKPPPSEVILQEKENAKKEKENAKDKDKAKEKDKDKKAVKNSSTVILKERPPTLIELVVFRDPPTVHVYHVVEHGRRFYSSLAFASDCFFTFADFPPAIASKQVLWPPTGAKLAAGRVNQYAFAPAQSLVITRNLSAADGVQMFVPPKFLFGLIPHALLERYDFWQNESDESLVGIPKDPNSPTKITVQLFKDKTTDESGYGGSMAYAVVKRTITINDGTNTSTIVHTLLNPLYAAPSSPLRTLAMLFGRVENLSHILMWSADEAVRRPNDSASIDLVELPRVRLSFKSRSASNAPDAELLFYSEEHAGLFISSKRDAGVMRLIDGLQCCLLLENDENDFFVLLPASSRPSRHVRPSTRNEPPCSDVIMDPGYQDWLKNLGKDVRHYLCPVHSSRTFLFTPTLASALYLLLLRFSARQYAEAFVLADVCVSDMPLSPEEKQSFDQLGNFKDDHHPDAHAVRLKITLATRGARDAQPLPWSAAVEYARYCAKFHAVSAACRLTIEEELSLIASGEVGDTSYDNRRVFLTSVQMNAQGADLIAPPFKTEFPQFDEVMDATALEDRKNASSWKSTLRKFSSAKPMSYSRPEDLVGSAALRTLEKYIRGGVSVRGTSGVGFPFIYEMMTGTLALRILNDDSCYNWGCLFLRLLPPKKYGKQQTMTSVLRILSYNPKFAAIIPKYEDTRKHKISIMFKGSSVIQKVLENANQFLRSHESEVTWPKFDPAKRMINADFPAKLTFRDMDAWRRNRLFRLNYRVSNLQLAQRVYQPTQGYEQDWPQFKDRPLNIECSTFVLEKTRRQRGLPDLQPKRMDVLSHPSTRSKAAREILQRIGADDANYCQDTNNEMEPEMMRTDSLVDLRTMLEQTIATDFKAVKEQINRIVGEVNTVAQASSRALGYALRKATGQEVPMVQFDFLVGLTMCTRGETDLQWLNPYLADTTKALWQDVMAGIMFRANRVKQAYRAFKLVVQCENARDQLRKRLAAESLARELAARRYYVGAKGEYDPRFLAFEFTNGLVLRKAQVELVYDFLGAMRRAEGAKCQQMIMGSGKTTVVGPLLALLLGDGKSIIVQVVPPALLEFSRSVMRECFSSAIFQKPVYTFQFDRVSSVTEGLVQKLRLARDSRSIVCTTPTAVKSFFLKLLEAAHNLDNARILRKGEEMDEGQGIRGALQRNVFGYSRLKKKRALDEQEKKALRLQLMMGLEIVEMFRTGALLLDEVDLILHPLKSELNWPIGVRLPLDFTYSKSRGVHGLRWQVPFHLLDAIFFASSNKTLAWATDDSREAMSLLEKLTLVIREGEERRLVQKTPHFVLLSKMYYTAKMKPLLGRWLVLFLIQKGVRGVRDDHLTNYLMNGPRRADPEAVRSAKENLSDDNLKLLNLSHDWLETYCPFVVSRIDRVKYGLLTKEDLERLSQFGPVPKNRRLMAVPFVGKDVPSRASEFSHPDVLIGLTTLAYRYEGLRYSDFCNLIRALRERIEDEIGPYHQRPSGALFIKWVELAGGRVRGTRLVERREQVEEAAATVVLTGGNSPAPDNEFDDLWPLQLLDVNDDAQMDVVYRLLRKLPHAALFYLHEIIFPETLQHQGLKLSACGQELGGTMLFKRRMGFSGTPSDLLPVELGSCQYERGSDGRMIHYLSDPEICSIRRTGPDWTVHSLLESLCDVDETGRPVYSALIDTGALITGMGNDEVAAFLLKRMPREHVDGVIFLDGDDRKMVVLRSDKVVPLDRCGIDISRRFTFYDQVHTTGMDIRQAPSARAALTLGKDMVFRDYAQGAFRMRQIAKGQTIELIIVPEVEMLIEVQCAAGRGIQLTGAALDSLLQTQRALPVGRARASVQFLQDVVAWLIINTCIAEKVQFNLLSEQSLNNVWRKRAFVNIESGSATLADSKFTQEDVDVFRERLDYSVENSIPKQKSFVGKLEQVAREKYKFLLPEDMPVVEKLLGDAKDSEVRDAPGNQVVSSVAGVEGDGSPEEVAKERAFNAEQVQEQEQEQEQQVEQEQEKEEERAEEDLQEEFVKKKYSRDDEAAVPWRVEDLSKAPPPPYFTPISQFAVHKSLLESIKPIRFPEPMLMSRNYYDKKWTLSTYRRLKNVICILEYIPDPTALLQPHQLHQLDPNLDPITLRPRPPLDSAKGAHLQRAFGMFDATGTSALDGTLALEVIRAMDVDISKADFIYLQKCFQFADQDRNGTLNFNEFRSFVEMRLFYQAACKGRYYVVLSLQEAESLRAILHRDLTMQKLGRASVALHSLASGSIIDCTRTYQPVSEYQDQTFTQLFRFLDSEVAYDERSIGILIRALQENDCGLRRTWFEDVRECRRRPRKYAVMDRPVARVLTTPHEYSALEYRATVIRVKELIYRRGMFMTDAFRAFDSNRDGLLSCSELYGALTWLGLGRLHEEQIHDMMRALDEDKDGQLSMVEFRKAFGDAAREEHIAKSGMHATIDFDGLNIPPRPIRELFEESKAHEEIVIPIEEYDKFRIKLKPPHNLEKAWSSHGSMSELEASVWRPELGDTSGGILRSNRVQLSLGHYAVKGQDRPSTGGGAFSMFFTSSGKESEYTTIEIKDEGRWGVSGQSIYMKPIVEALFPHPVRFQQLWSQPRGSPIFAWRGIPPRKEFVFMGVVVTTTDDPPATTDYRCVPRHWCVKATRQPVFVWKDAGAAGGKKGSIYNINSMGLCSINEGHEPIIPESGFWDLKERMFRISAADMEIVKGPASQRASAQQTASSSSPAASGSSSALPPELETDDPNRPSLDATRYKAPPAPRLEPARFPVHVFASPAEYSDDRRNVDVVGFTHEEDTVKKAHVVTKGKVPPPPPPGGGPPSASTAVTTSPPDSASEIPPPRPQKSSTAAALQAQVVHKPQAPLPGAASHHAVTSTDDPVGPPPRPSKPSSLAQISVPVGAAEPPPRPSKPSSLAAISVPITTTSSTGAAVPPSRPSKPSSQVLSSMSSEQSSSSSPESTPPPASVAPPPVPQHPPQSAVPPARPSKPSTQAAISVPLATGGEAAPPPRPTKPSSQVAVKLPPAGAEPPPRPTKPSSHVAVPGHHTSSPPAESDKSVSASDELAAALAKRKAKSEG